MASNWMSWVPFPGIPNTLYFRRLRHDQDGSLTIDLVTDDNAEIYHLSFDSFLSYRFADEGDLLNTIHEAGNIFPGPFFTTRNSSLLDWFHAETQGNRASEGITHFGIFTPNEVFEVLTLSDPILQIRKS